MPILRGRIAAVVSAAYGLVLAITYFAASAYAAETRNLVAISGEEKRVALVIGNNAYQSVPVLEKAANDARAIGRALERAGFQTRTVINGSRNQMNMAINQFVEDVSGGGIGVFFFAGHGVQVANQNFLIPVDLQSAVRDADLADQGISLQSVQDKIADAKARFTLLVLDACRDNPLPKKAGRAIGGARGLSQASSAEGQIVIFSAGANQQALDKLGPVDTNPNGVFTREFLPWIAKPGVTIRDAVLGVRSAVRAKAKTVDHDQFPAIYDQAEGNFYFTFAEGHATRPTPAAPLMPPMSAARTPQQIEDDLWDSIKSSDKAAVFEEYVKQYPKGRYLAQAKIKLADLRQANKSPPMAQGAPTSQEAINVGDPKIDVANGTEEARRHLLRGTAAVELAKSAGDLADAAQEFRKATELAPTWAAAWFNLAVVETKAGQYASAIAAYRRYLALAPNATDAQKVQNEIVKLEYQLERSAKRDKLVGNWIARIPTGFTAGPQFHTETYKVALDGGEFRMEPHSSQQWLWREFKLYTPDQLSGGKLVRLGSPKIANARLIFSGRLDGDKIRGERIRAGFFDAESKCRTNDHRTPFEGRIEEDGEVLVITFDEPRYRAVWDYKSYFSSSGEAECLRLETDPPERQEFRLTRASKAANSFDQFFGNFVTKGTKAPPNSTDAAPDTRRQVPN